MTFAAGVTYARVQVTIHPDIEPRGRGDDPDRAVQLGRCADRAAGRDDLDHRRRLSGRGGRRRIGAATLRTELSPRAAARAVVQPWRSSSPTGRRSSWSERVGVGTGRGLTAQERVDLGEEVGTRHRSGPGPQRPSEAHAGSFLGGVGRAALGRPAHRAPPCEPRGDGVHSPQSLSRSSAQQTRESLGSFRPRSVEDSDQWHAVASPILGSNGHATARVATRHEG